MDVRDIQRLLSAAGLYKGAIDGDAGPLTMAAVAVILGRQDAVPWKAWPKTRQLIAAGQAVLLLLGHEPGRIDGLIGHNTLEALTDWASGAIRAAVERILQPAHAVSDTQGAYPRQDTVATFYGAAGGPDCTAGVVTLPVPFRIAWDLGQAVSSFRCHKLVADPLTRIFRQAVAHYGVTEFERLKLNVFGGCYNYRKMRGGSSLSMHAWGIAVDLDPERNQLRWGRDRAAFAAAAYAPFWNIVEAAGATSLGRACNKDWMHFQFARL
ncbi:peptidoglycan-binding protein [Rhodobacter sp. NSM]|uniref:peptidoglycan-binding protein n=1 Tax=Rhodobacter sp. NSM TaxID=3457501 RepID=UPI003FD1042A